MRKILSLLFVSLFLAGSLMQPLVVAGQQNVDQVQVASFPFSEDFESGTFIVTPIVKTEKGKE